jgi:hypothetical protein
VQCTGKKYAACGEQGGKALVCDSKQRQCSVDKEQESAGPCQPCVSDAQCRAGQLCAEQQYNGKSVGYFCFWKQGDTANSAPADCVEERNRPYVNAVAGTKSVDGESATLCMLTAGTTSCIALAQYRTKNCAPEGHPDDSLCGFAPGEDSKCMKFGVSQYRCATTCVSYDDCRGSSGDGSTGITCDLGEVPSVCTFN